MLKFFIIISALFYNVQLLAHARLLPNGLVPPRSTNAGIKIGPCGGIPRTLTPKVLQAGSTINIHISHFFHLLDLRQEISTLVWSWPLRLRCITFPKASLFLYL